MFANATLAFLANTLIMSCNGQCYSFRNQVETGHKVLLPSLPCWRAKLLYPDTFLLSHPTQTEGGYPRKEVFI